jgi:hypothetical protein
MEVFFSQLTRYQNMLLVVSVWVALATFKAMFKRAAKSRLYARIAPLLPVLLCSAGVWIPGVADDHTIGTRIMLGVILGAITANSHKILKQSIIGKDERIPTSRLSKFIDDGRWGKT